MNSSDYLESQRIDSDTSLVAPVRRHNRHHQQILDIHQFYDTVRMQGFENEVWKTQALNILLWILRFISVITKSNFATSFRLINRNIFRIIGDQSSNYQFYLMRNYFKYQKPLRLNKVRYWFANNPLVIKLENNYYLSKLLKINIIQKPESYKVFIWRIICVLMINLSIFSTTIQFAFEQKPNIVYWVPFITFLCEIFITMHIGYYDKGKLEMRRRFIIYNYMRSSLFLDLSIIITQILKLKYGIEYLDMIVIFKLVKLPNHIDLILDRVELNTIQMALYDFVRLVYLIILSAHLVACCWFFIGVHEKQEITWITVQNIENLYWVEQYGHSLYWSIITMTTIGYGDVTPANLTERSFMIFFAVFSCCIFGYSIGNISDILDSISKNSNQLRIDINGLKKYLRVKGYSEDLSMQIRKHFEYLWRDEIYNLPFDVEKLQQKIPPQLKHQMIMDINLRCLKQIEFLSEHFNKEFLEELATKFFEHSFAPEQSVFMKGQMADNFHILREGLLEQYLILPEDKIIPIQRIAKVNECIGQREFFMETHHSMNCRAVYASKVLSISKADFIEVAKKHGYEQYCTLRDKVQLTQDQLIFCRGCGKFTHQLFQCPLVTGFPNRSKVLLNYRRNTYQERHKVNRTNLKRKISTLTREQEITDSVLGYILSNEELQKQILTSKTLKRLTRPMFKGSASSPIQKSDYFKSTHLLNKLQKVRDDIKLLTHESLGDEISKDDCIQKDCIPTKNVKYRESLNFTEEILKIEQWSSILDFEKSYNFLHYQTHMNLETIISHQDQNLQTNNMINFFDVNMTKKKFNPQRSQTLFKPKSVNQSTD